MYRLWSHSFISFRFIRPSIQISANNKSVYHYRPLVKDDDLLSIGEPEVWRFNKHDPQNRVLLKRDMAPVILLYRLCIICCPLVTFRAITQQTFKADYIQQASAYIQYTAWRDYDLQPFREIRRMSLRSLLGGPYCNCSFIIK